jgi:hypothetical protein
VWTPPELPPNPVLEDTMEQPGSATVAVTVTVAVFVLTFVVIVVAVLSGQTEPDALVRIVVVAVGHIDAKLTEIVTVEIETNADAEHVAMNTVETSVFVAVRLRELVTVLI